MSSTVDTKTLHSPEAVVDLAALRHNVSQIRAHVAGKQIMAIVKGNAYGHGLVPAATSALTAGAASLGVAAVPEALQLRKSGISEATRISPISGIAAAQWGLKPALSVHTPIVQVKWMPAGSRIGYEENHRLTHDGYLGLVPLGFAHGVPKQAQRADTVLVAGTPRRIAGKVSMDQFMIELGPEPVPVGTVATLLGTSDDGTIVDANTWGEAVGSFGDEIVSQFGFSLPRRYVDG